MAAKFDSDSLKEPDVFHTVSERIFHVIERHAKTLAALILVLIVGGVGYVAYGYIGASREQRAAEALFKPEAALKKAQSDVREERAKKMSNLAGDKKVGLEQNKMVRPADFAKDYAPLVEKVKAEIAAHKNTKSALVSALNLAYFLTEQKQFGPALDVLKTVTYEPASGDLLNGFLQMHRGLTLLENAQVDPAIAAYDSVLKTPALRNFHPEAMLKLGVAYQIKGDTGKARDTFEKLSHEFPETEASNTALNYIRLLDLQSHKQG